MVFRSRETTTLLSPEHLESYTCFQGEMKGNVASRMGGEWSQMETFSFVEQLK